MFVFQVYKQEPMHLILKDALVQCMKAESYLEVKWILKSCTKSLKDKKKGASAADQRVIDAALRELTPIQAFLAAPQKSLETDKQALGEMYSISVTKPEKLHPALKDALAQCMNAKSYPEVLNILEKCQNFLTDKKKSASAEDKKALETALQKLTSIQSIVSTAQETETLGAFQQALGKMYPLPADRSYFYTPVTEAELVSQRTAIANKVGDLLVPKSLDEAEQMRLLYSGLKADIEDYYGKIAKNFASADIDRHIAALQQAILKSDNDTESAGRKMLHDQLFRSVFTKSDGHLSVDIANMQTNIDNMFLTIKTLHAFDQEFKNDILDRSVSPKTMQLKYSQYSGVFSTPEMQLLLGRTYGFDSKGLESTRLVLNGSVLSQDLPGTLVSEKYLNLMLRLADNKNLVLKQYASLSTLYPGTAGAAARLAGDVVHLPPEKFPGGASRPAVDVIGLAKTAEILLSYPYNGMTDEQATSLVISLESLEPKTQYIPLSSKDALDRIIRTYSTPSTDYNRVLSFLASKFLTQNEIFRNSLFTESSSRALGYHEYAVEFCSKRDAQLLDHLHSKYVPLGQENHVTINGFVPNRATSIGMYGMNLFMDQYMLNLHPDYSGFGIPQQLNLPLGQGLRTPNIREDIWRNQDQAERFRRSPGRQGLQYPYVENPVIQFFQTSESLDQAYKDAYNKAMRREGPIAFRSLSLSAAFAGDPSHLFQPKGSQYALEGTVNQQGGRLYDGTRFSDSISGDLESKTRENLLNSQNLALPILSGFLDSQLHHLATRTTNKSTTDMALQETLDGFANARMPNANVIIVGTVNNTAVDSQATLRFSKLAFEAHFAGSLNLQALHSLESNLGFSTANPTVSLSEGNLVAKIRAIKAPGGAQLLGDDAIFGLVAGLRTDPSTVVNSTTDTSHFSDIGAYAKYDPAGTWVRMQLTDDQKATIARQTGVENPRFADTMTHDYYLFHTEPSGTANAALETYNQELGLTAKSAGTPANATSQVGFAFGYQVPKSVAEIAAVGAKTLEGSKLVAVSTMISESHYLGGAFFSLNADEIFQDRVRSQGTFRLGQRRDLSGGMQFSGGAIDYMVKNHLDSSLFLGVSENPAGARQKNEALYGGKLRARSLFGMPLGVTAELAARTDNKWAIANYGLNFRPSSDFDFSSRGGYFRDEGGYEAAGATVGLMKKVDGKAKYAVVASGEIGRNLNDFQLSTRTLTGIRKSLTSLQTANLEDRDSIGQALANVWNGFGAYQNWNLTQDMSHSPYGTYGIQVMAGDNLFTMISSRVSAGAANDVFYTGMFSTGQFGLFGGTLVKKKDIPREPDQIREMIGAQFGDADFAFKVQAATTMNSQTMVETGVSLKVSSDLDVAARSRLAPFTHTFDLYLGKGTDSNAKEWHGVISFPSRLDGIHSYGAEVGSSSLLAGVDLAFKAIVLRNELSDGEIAKSFNVGLQAGWRDLFVNNSYFTVEAALQQFEVKGIRGASPYINVRFNLFK